MSAFLQVLHQLGRHEGSGQVGLPVAVIISKMDAFDLWRQVDTVRASIQADSPARAEGQACRQCLIEWGAGNTVRVLEHYFKRVAYFRYQTKATGLHSPQRPLLWLLSMDAQFNREGFGHTHKS